MKNNIYIFTVILLTMLTTNMYSQIPVYDEKFDLYEEKPEKEPKPEEPKYCKDKIPLRIDTTIVVEKDSTAQPSSNLGERPTGYRAEGDKAVIFLHGLGGNEDAWANARTHSVDDFRVFQGSPTYSSQQVSIPDAFPVLNTKIEGINHDVQYDNPDYEEEETIVIAHSLGGVVTRFMDKKYETEHIIRQFGGFATFGSAHAGAPVIDNIDDIGLLITEGCEAMTEPYIVDFLQQVEGSIPGWTEFLFPKTVTKFVHAITSGIDEVQSFTCNDFGGGLFQLLESTIAPPIGQDLSPSSGLIAELSGFTTQIPGLAFYGIEEEPVSLREIYSFHNNVNGKDEDGVYYGWGGANQDDTYIGIYDNISDNLELQYEYNNLHTVSYSLLDYLPTGYIELLNLFPQDIVEQFLTDLCFAIGGDDFNFENLECIFNITNPELAEAYYDAWMWWEDFNRNYKIIFGHLTLDMVASGTEYECICYIPGDYETNPDDPEETFMGSCEDYTPELPFLICYETVVTTYTIIDSPHDGDGVVPAYSAKSFSGAIQSIEMKNSNHQQMRNDVNTAKGFRRMYSGLYDDKFYQEER